MSPQTIDFLTRSPYTAPVSGTPQVAPSRPGQPSAGTPLATGTFPRDEVSFSLEGRRLAEENATTLEEEQEKKDKGSDKLSEDEKQELEEMRRREQEVITHERAHQATGGQYASAPQYSYRRGPDGDVYVADGEVSIDLSTIPGDPQATIQKAQQVRAAALAPSEPSGQDMRVASAAMQMALDAQRQLAEEQRKEQTESRTETAEGEKETNQAMTRALEEEPSQGQPGPLVPIKTGRANPYEQPAPPPPGEIAIPTRRSIDLTA